MWIEMTVITLSQHQGTAKSQRSVSKWNTKIGYMRQEQGKMRSERPKEDEHRSRMNKEGARKKVARKNGSSAHACRHPSIRCIALGHMENDI